MSETREPICPECDAVDRRDFFRFMGASAAVAAVGGTALAETQGPEKGPMPRIWTPNVQAENLIKELYSGMSAEQKKTAESDKKSTVCHAFEDKGRQSLNPNRFFTIPIGKVFDKKQIELIERIVKAIGGGDDAAYRQISRAGTWDASKTFDNTGANIFGEPGKGKFAFLFTGHHLTIRCDGDSEEGAAFGGPIYYGHTPNGYSDQNVFSYQTKQVMKAFDALDAKQREKALVKKGNPGEGPKSVVLPKKSPGFGIPYGELTSDQKELVMRVMRDLLSPFRKEDGDEVMAVIKATGGMDKVHLAFYSDEYDNAKTNEKQPWTFWRLEGPGFVWNYRVLPHVHTFVNISSKIG